MREVEIASSFEELEAILRRPAPLDEPVMLTKAGRIFATLVPDGDTGGPDAETAAVWSSPVFQALLAQSDHDIADGRVHSLEDVARELGVMLPEEATATNGNNGSYQNDLRD